MHKANTSLAIKLAAIAAAISVSGVALAQPTTTAEAAGPVAEQSSSQSPDAKRHSHGFHKHHGQMHRHHHQKAAMLVPGYGALNEKGVEALKLNADQVKLLEDAREAHKSQRKNNFASFKEQRTERLQALKDGKLDPKSAFEQSQEKRKVMLEQQDKIAGKWLALWDSLHDGQRKLVAQQFVDKAEKRAERMKKHAERRASQEKTQEAAS